MALGLFEQIITDIRPQVDTPLLKLFLFLHFNKNHLTNAFLSLQEAKVGEGEQYESLRFCCFLWFQTIIGWAPLNFVVEQGIVEVI